MCGIAGYYGQGNREILERMTNSLAHRGPDDQGFFVEGEVGLGHRRLSIIDLSPGGHQPMSNEDSTVWVVFNGEIYNFLDLKKELKAQHKFSGNSDTEIIIHLYEEIGEKIFEKFNGMFALAIYDKKKERLILARDRMGKKPLYWTLANGTLIFGSELKALYHHPLFKKELNLEALNKFLQYEYIPTPHCIIKNVFKLEPASYIVFHNSLVEKKQYWRLADTFTKSSIFFSDAISELDKRLNEAIKTRLMSDVPLGIFLSGGIDSSAITYYAQKNSTQKIKTFSIGFSDDSFDESQFARQVADYLGTDHHEQILEAKDCLDLIPKVANLIDEPMADQSIIPTFLLSQVTRKNVTVALGGDGSDELFCGYDPFIAHRLALIYEKLPRFIRNVIMKNIVNALPTSFRNFSFDFRAKTFVNNFHENRIYRDISWMGSFNYGDRKRLLKPEVWDKLENKNALNDIDDYILDIKESSYFDQLIMLYLRMYLMDDIMVKVDRASMFNSLEVRSPLLDHNIVSFANSLPLNFKLHGLTTKHILKKLMADKLPQNIVYRKKKGFGMPTAEWFANELKPLVHDLLNENNIKDQGIFDYRYTNKLLDDHFSRRVDNRKQLWTLLIFELWYSRWM